MSRSLKLALGLLLFLAFALPPITSAQDNVTCPGTLPSRLMPGEGARLVAEDTLNLRSQPVLAGEIVAQLSGEAVFAIRSGPVCADGYAWWEVTAYFEGRSEDGWVVESADQAYTLEPNPLYERLNGNEITCGDIGFAFDESIGTGVRVSVLERMSWDDPDVPDDIPDWSLHPNTVRFTLMGYPLANTNWLPVLALFSAEDFTGLVDRAAEQVTAMRALLADDPQSLQGPEVPILPLNNARPLFQAQQRYIPFQNGGGFRFITVLAQVVNFPIQPDMDFLYFYQGLSADGNQWVSFQSQIHMAFPADFPVAPNQDSADEAWEAYFTEAITRLNSLQPSDFTPNLDTLDALAGSIAIPSGGVDTVTLDSLQCEARGH